MPTYKKQVFEPKHENFTTLRDNIKIYYDVKR